MQAEGPSLPRVVILDLDYTLWPTNAFEEAQGPYESTDEIGVARQLRCNRLVSCYDGVPQALQWLTEQGVAVAIASATPSGRNALGLLTAMQLVPPHMEDEWRSGRFFVCKPGAKFFHLQRALQDADCSAEEAIFFDDLSYNIHTATRLGVSAVEIDRRGGFSLPVLLAGLEDWRRYRQPSIMSYFFSGGRSRTTEQQDVRVDSDAEPDADLSADQQSDAVSAGGQENSNAALREHREARSATRDESSGAYKTRGKKKSKGMRNIATYFSTNA
uniref:Magnesium-dependent phosphatase-1 n=1 Tax=Pinguiococcus pyrenoidosus TaxID=172671 RepID=A0A7R9UC66_9STRA